MEQCRCAAVQEICAGIIQNCRENINNLYLCSNFVGDVQAKVQEEEVSDNLKEAIECCTTELGIAREVGNKIHEGGACFVLGHCFEYMGSWGAALSYYQSSVKLVNDVRHLLPPKDDWKMNLRDQFQSSYSAVCRVLLDQGKTTEALCAADQGRTQSLIDLMVSSCGLLLDEFSPSEREEANSNTLDRYILSQTVFIAVNVNSIDIWTMQKGKDVQCDRLKVVGQHMLKGNANMFLQSLKQKVHQEIGIVEPNSEDDSPNEKSYLQLYYGVVIGPITLRTVFMVKISLLSLMDSYI